MTILYVVKDQDSDKFEDWMNTVNLGDRTFQDVSDLQEISHLLELESLASVLNTRSQLSDLLLNVIVKLVATNLEVAAQNLLATVDGLLRVDQVSLVQGLLNVVSCLIQENASRFSIEDIIMTVRNSIHQLQSVGALSYYVPTYQLLMTAAIATEQPQALLTPKKMSSQKIAFRTPAPIH